MKTILRSVFLSFLFIISIAKVMSQNIQKYDYLEVIVIQKSNNSGKIKRIKVEEQSSLEGKSIAIKEMEALKGTSDLLNYMNAANWEFVDKKATNGGKKTIWISYIFRKMK